MRRQQGLGWLVGRGLLSQPQNVGSSMLVHARCRAFSQAFYPTTPFCVAAVTLACRCVSTSRPILCTANQQGGSNNGNSGESIDDLLSELDDFDTARASTNTAAPRTEKNAPATTELKKRRFGRQIQQQSKSPISSENAGAAAAQTATAAAAADASSVTNTYDMFTTTDERGGASDAGTDLAAHKSGKKTAKNAVVDGDARVRQLRQRNRQLKEKKRHAAAVVAELRRELGDADAATGDSSSGAATTPAASAAALETAPDAAVTWTTSELLADSSPQHFVASSVASSSPPTRSPLPLRQSGCAAVVTLVGRVAAAPQLVRGSDDLDASGAGSGTAVAAAEGRPDDSDDTERDDPCARLQVVYDLPAPVWAAAGGGPTPASALLTVYCVGPRLALYAHRNIRQGDVVHVLGHLAPRAVLPLPLPPGDAEEGPDVCVVALPVGGNITVLISNGE